LAHTDLRINDVDKVGQTALHIACYFGKHNIVKILLAHPRIDIDVKGIGKITPLMLALETGQPKCVEELVKMPGINLFPIVKEGTKRNGGKVGQRAFLVLKSAQENFEREKRKLEKEEKNKKEKEMRYEKDLKEQRKLEEQKKTDKKNRTKYEEKKRAEKEERVKEERIRADEKKKMKKENAQREEEIKNESKMMELLREKDPHKEDGNTVETRKLDKKENTGNTNKGDKYSCEEKLAKLKEENKTLAQAVEAKSREADEARKTMEEMFEANLKVKPAMVEFLERQVAVLEEELECPVCLEVLTTSPIYKCADDHLICPGCRPKVKICPQCREKYPPGSFKRFREAERKTERLADFREQVAI